MIFSGEPLFLRHILVNIKRLIIWSIIGTGISSVTTQLLTIREFLSQFHGNEITISLVIFCWLLVTGLGSLIAKAVRRSSLSSFTILTLIIAVWPLLQIIVIREFRETIFIHGTSPGFYPIFFYIIVTVTPYCLLTGFILPYAQKVLNDHHYPFRSGDLYLTDSVGDITGGIIFSFVLVYWLKPFVIIAVTSTLLIFVGLLLLVLSRMYVFFVTGLVLVCVFYFYSTNNLFEKLTLTRQYGDIVRYLESPYGRIVISKEGAQHTFWESGVPLYSDSNVINSEEKIHYPLCQLDRVKDVLLVSGGFGEVFDEVSKYAPERVDYVELDPYLTDAGLSEGAIKKAPFLAIMNTDGRRHIKVTKRMYDAIIIDLPDPDTFQINRFFTSEFFFLAKAILKKNGILSMSVEYAPNYISNIRKKKLSILYNTARLHFRNVMALPGEEAYFLCRDGKLWKDIPGRLKLKSINTNYIEGFFHGNVTDERMRQLEEVLDTTESVNKDFRPRLMNIVFQEWFMKHGTSPKYFLVVLFVLTMVYLIFMRREEYILFSTGLATMGVEMLIVFAFQVIYGYIYLKIGAIVTASLLGLLPGAIIGNSLVKKGRNQLFVSEMLILFLLFLFLLWVMWFKGEPHPTYFLAYCFLFSLLCGFQFPVAAAMIGEKSSPAAACFAADLCGASVGTLATGTILIPLWGIQAAVIFLILVKISSSIITYYIKKIRG
jgi:spermidine synthase